MQDEASDENLDERMATLCPNAAGKWRVTSPRDRRYNCFGWALHDTTIAWYPGGDPTSSKWPPGASTALDPESIQIALAQLGFEVTTGLELEPGVERIALFADEDGDVVHVARQLPSGAWSSKLGRWEDIEHADLEALEGGDYGKVVAFMKRAISEPQELS